ncbi:DUF11 domain-containing protein [Polaribacter haliotis]|uniref:DUF11 domain-containing protein n=1 Tax=Polaribacter haliotis TaxID=1888915 RepID=A0A7L8ADL3_9FLAO|nr:DUF11 domain-containing protein [Polaribacter haliotis]QOD60113.1 DUF11 domain-containing protein [Polaribacter haliotis]
MKKKYLPLNCSIVKQFFLFSKSKKTVLYIVLLFLLSFVNIIKAQDSFESDFDGWDQVSGDDMNWSRDIETPSSNTGPDLGSDGDFFLFIEASSNSGKKAWIEKEFDLTGKQKSQLNFDYHMYGSNMGSLNVLVNKNGVLTNVFSRSGDKGDVWLSATADLSAFDGDVIKIRFEGIVGSNFRSDAAIDNISVTSTPDTDGDGIIDDEDADADNDGILNVDEGCAAVVSSDFNLVPSESVLGDMSAGGKLVYKDAAGNKVVLEAAGSVGSNNIVGVGPNDGTIITDINNGKIAFEIGKTDSAADQPKLKITTFSAAGVPFKVTSIGLGGIGNMDNSSAQDAIAMDVPGTWSNLTSAGNTLGSAQITTSPIGATPVNNVTQTELDAFDFTNFVTQGAVSEVIFNNADNNVQFGYNATFSPTNPTSSFNLIVDDINIDDGVGRNIVAELSTTSISVAAIYCRDTDSDGIPDYLDTDSDGDGCSDADEAYFGTVTNADTDDNGTYGSGTPTVDGVGKVSGAAYTSPNAYYIDASVNACFDNDNDGVPDSVDLDDDNDGILDGVECPDISFSKNLIINNAQRGNLTVVEGGASGTPFVSDAGPNNNEQGLRYIDQAPMPTYYRLNTKGEDYTYIDGNNLVFRLYVEDPGESFFGGTSDIRLGSGATQLTLDLTQDPFAQTKPVGKTDFTISVPLTASNFGVSQAQFNSVIASLDYIDIRAEFWLGPTGTTESELVPLLSDPCDIDNDGIPNYNDSDSDGDGCSDADEAYLGSVANADADNNGFYGSGTPTVGTDGKVSGAPYTTPNAYYLDASINACEDNDNDGIPDSVDLDDDNDGILDSVENNCTTATTGFFDWDTDFGVSPSGSDISGSLPIISNLVDNHNLTVSFVDNPSNPGLEYMSVEDAFGLGTVLQIVNASGETGGGITTFAFTNEVNNLTFTMQDIDARGSDFKDRIIVTAKRADGTIVVISETTNIISKGSAVSYQGNNEIIGIGDVDSPNQANGVLKLKFTEPITEISFQYFNDLTSPNTRQRIGIADLEYEFVCDSDFDNDGIPNAFDTDSDGDGCSDADEAYYGSVSNADTDDDGAYGTSPVTVDGQGKVAGAGYITPNAFYLNADINACEDNDNDGIIDSVDLDDDNDGILDTGECTTNLRAANGDFDVAISGSNPVLTQTFANSFSITYTNIGGSSIASYSEPTKEADELYAIGTQFKYVYPNEGSTQQMTFSSPVKLKFMVTDIDQLGEKHRVTVYDKTGAIIPNPENFIVNTAEGTTGSSFATRTPKKYPDLGLDVTKDGTISDDYVELSQEKQKDNDTYTRRNLVFFDFKELEISKIVVQNLSNSGQPGFLFDSIRAACDTDLDGIPDYQDTDSDNDGCPDAIEGAGDIQLGQLTALTGGSVGGSLNNLGTTSDAEGNPLVNSTGYEQNNTAAVLDANDATACSIDLSVTKIVNKPIKKVGEKIVFTITLKNDGNQPATNVNVIDLLPPGLTYDAATTVIPTNTTYDSSTGIWDLSLLTLAKGSSYQLKIGATVNTAGTIYTNKTEVFSTTETDIDSTPNSNN